ncbi:MAG: AMP-binding protein [Terriglobia bacterium]
MSDSQPQSLNEVLQFQAKEHGSIELYSYLLEGTLDGRVETWTLEEVDRRARRVAAALAPHAVPGARALLQFPPGLDFIAAFYGCLYAGVVAVPAAPPESARLEATLPRLLGIMRDAKPGVILTVSVLQTLVEETFEFAALPSLAVDKLDGDIAFTPYSAAPDELAFLQYTSGSTGDPRGVMVTHRNILANHANIAEAFCLREGSERGVSWLPMFHDMGLLGKVIAPLCVAGPVTFMSPLDFMRRPLSWLDVISRLGATISGAPNFAYELCARRAKSKALDSLDLSRWRVAFCGAEPIYPATLERFAKTFAPCGFDPHAFLPTYGLAEATLFISGSARGEKGQARCFDSAALAQGRAEPSASGRALMGCGEVVGQEVRVVGPGGFPLPERLVGEIWVRGDNVGKGYWRRPEETRGQFGAMLGTGEGPYLRTGDLGFLHQGELFLCGRKKDLLIIRGRNLHPQDIERSVEQAHSAVRSGRSAAFSVENGEEEKLVVVAEARGTGSDFSDVFAAIRGAVSREHGADLYAIALIKPRTIPKTSSGKIRRQACKELWLAGNLETISEERSTREQASPSSIENETLEWIVAWIKRNTDSPNVRPEMTFAEAGLDSLGAVQLAADLEENLGFEVPAERFFDARLDQAAALLDHGRRSIGKAVQRDFEREAEL